MFEDLDWQLLGLVAKGLPLCPRPYAQIGLNLAMTESEVIARLSLLQQHGLIKRLGVIVKHRQLGYHANAMIVWDIPDGQVKKLGIAISGFPFVTLCYQRPRRPQWPYNLYGMIHGKDRATVLAQLAGLESDCGLDSFDKQILFSRRCFKQQGAVYPAKIPQEAAHG